MPSLVEPKTVPDVILAEHVKSEAPVIPQLPLLDVNVNVPELALTSVPLNVAGVPPPAYHDPLLIRLPFRAG